MDKPIQISTEPPVWEIRNVPDFVQLPGYYDCSREGSTVILNWHHVDNFFSHLKKQIEVRTTRVELLAKLRAQGLTSVEMEYSGYGDSGDISDHTGPREVAEMLWEFMWEVHAGFENNDGGGGAVIWNLETDVIRVEHHDFVTETVDADPFEV